jgi:transposase
MDLSQRNENVRKDLIEYLKNNGIKNRFIANHVGLSDTTICLFIKGTRKLAIDKLESIEELINRE